LIKRLPARRWFFGRAAWFVVPARGRNGFDRAANQSNDRCSYAADYPEGKAEVLLQILPTGFNTLSGFPPAMWFKASRINTISPSDEIISIASLSQFVLATGWLCPRACHT
jgi:hypothetical protein